MISLLLCVTLLAYCVAIIYLIFGFSKVNQYPNCTIQPQTKFSIIVPFRNEEGNLPLLIESISKLNYPHEFFEVILVDDDSNPKFQISDFYPDSHLSNTIEIVLIDNVRTSKSPKKDAISTAIKIAKNDWIITTDADCLVPENWLLTIDNYIQTHSVSMIVGAVTYSKNCSFLHYFQQLDLASLQGVTIGSFGLGKGFMCNGANFAYTKSLFEDINGFIGNDKIASGDDVFLLQKAFIRYPEKIHYLKSTHNIVTTKPLNSWTSLFHQRVRWASKTVAYQSSFSKVLGFLALIGNTSMWFVYYKLLFGHKDFIIMSCLIASKFLVDYIIIKTTNHFLRSKTYYFLISSFIYPLFSVLVATYSLLGNYKWKGRKF